MNKNSLLGLITLALIVFCANSSVMAQSAQQIDQWTAQLNSKDWRDRQTAASSLMELPVKLRTERIRRALIAELKSEHDKIQKGTFEKCLDCEEGVGELGYADWLLDTVSNFKDDEAFSFFVQIGYTPALLKYGDRGIVAIVKKLDAATSCNARFFDIKVLSEILKQEKGSDIAQGKIRNSIKASIIKALDKSKHPDKSVEWFDIRAKECGNVRIQIARALSYLPEAGDNEAMPIIITLAENDPYFVDLSKKKDYKGPEKIYFVRDEAQKIVDRLKIKTRK